MARACWPNSAETANDTSSEAAAANCTVGAAAAALAPLIADLMPAKSVAAAASVSEFAITNDMTLSRRRCERIADRGSASGFPGIHAPSAN
ncbi:hypothetical protein LRC484719_49430 [Mycobacterium riyadhense]